MVVLLFIEFNGKKEPHYREIAKSYVNFVHKQSPSIKEYEHQRRFKKSCADIHLGEFMQAHHNQQIFLPNESNKSQFVSLLNKHLELMKILFILLMAIPTL